jgi:hypothetical protein
MSRKVGECSPYLLHRFTHSRRATPQPGFTPFALNTAAASGVFR